MKLFQFLHKYGLSLISILLLFSFGYGIGENVGYEKGINDMFYLVTDSILSIIEHQVDEGGDSTVLEMVIINPDTNTYYFTNQLIPEK